MEILKDTFIPSRAHVPYGKNNEIVIRNLSKNYGKKTALENVSVTIHSGMYGLLGRNGAGKTSLMRILATLSEASGGEISMNGIPIKETGKIREIVGYLPQDFSFYRGMSVYGAMDYLGLLSEIPDKIRRERIGIARTGKSKRRYEDESKGFIGWNEKTAGDCTGTVT